MNAKDNLLKVVFDKCTDYATKNYKDDAEDLIENFKEVHDSWKKCSDKYASETKFFKFE